MFILINTFKTPTKETSIEILFRCFANSIPSEYLIQDGYGKYILRESMKGILNEKVRTKTK